MDRINPFGNLDDFSAHPKPKPVNKADIAHIADEQGFPSRQSKGKSAAQNVRSPRRYTTGRNQQMNIKATAETVALFYRLADEEGCTLGELLDKALRLFEVSQAVQEPGTRRGQKSQ